MAKKRKATAEETQRQTRKEILVARKQAQQTRQLRLAIGGVAVLLGLVFAVAIVNELFIAPNRPVAAVSGEEITLRQWQNRVRYERAQRILVLENQLEAFGGDVGIIQQFAGQLILELQDTETLAQDVLDRMVNEVAMRQMADVRGITVSEADIDKEIEEAFSYFDGESPTPFPTATETVIPTPSLTPIPTAVITELLPTATAFPTFTPGPTGTPFPTATPVSQEAFQERFEDLLNQFQEFGVDEETYRSIVAIQLIEERLIDAVAEDGELPQEALQASVFLLTFDDEESANEASSLIAEGDFLTTWNTLRSAPSELTVTGTASELLWRTQEDLIASIGEQASQEAFTLPLGEPSDVLSRVISEESTRYYILQVSGREVRSISESAFQQDKREYLVSIIDLQLAGNLETSDFWRGRVPTQPVLDPKFLAAPTATPGLAVPTPDEGS
jgi:hypothetical protein